MDKKKNIMALFMFLLTVFLVPNAKVLAAENFAYGKTVEATTIKSSDYQASKAVDADENHLLGKKLIFLGSSVTYGYASEGVSFVDYLKQRNGCTVVKEAVSGTTLAVSKVADSYVERMERNLSSQTNVDHFICQLSTNDASNSNIALGSISDSKDINVLQNNKGTIIGAMEYIIAYAKNKWNCPVSFYTGIKYSNDKYVQMIDALYDLQEKWGIGIIDLYNNTSMNSVSAADRARYMSDTVHPTAAGYLEWVTPVFEQYFREFYAGDASNTTVLNAAASKKKVLDYLYSIKGKQTVIGIHNREPNSDPARQTNQAYAITGQYAGLWSGDFLFSSSDVNNRWNMIYECEKQWNSGSIVQLMLHVTNPTQGESGNWDGGVCSKLSDAQWDTLITNGGDLNKKWKARLDTYATYLQYLKDKGVPVLFRPFHEMNQAQFWWAGRTGTDGSGALFRLTRDYLEKEKGLDNIIWVWDMQDLSYDWSSYNPGNDYWDIFAVDVYNSDYFTSYKYNLANQIAGDKLMAVGECDKLPTAEELKAQPNWSFVMSWAELTFSYNNNTQIQNLYWADNVIIRSELPSFKVSGGTSDDTTTQDENIAYMKTIEVSTTESYEHDPSYAVDADGNTRWSSEYADEQFMIVDLGDYYELSRFRIAWETAYASQYQIQVSTDHNTWETVYENYNATGGTQTIDVSVPTARYVKIYCIKRATSYGFSIYEFEAYGQTHTTKKISGVSATCEKSGNIEYFQCESCSNYFRDSECSDLIDDMEVVIVPATGHTEVIDAAVKATCTETGKTEGKHCSVCDKVMVAQEVVAATGHTEVVDAAVEATCEEAGKTEGKHCSVCSQVLVEQEDVPATGHTEVVDAAVEATCETTGKREGKHCSVCNQVLVVQEVVPATGHAWDNGKVTKEATETEAGEKTYTCRICDKNEIYVIPIIGHSHMLKNIARKDATCVTEGNIAYYECESCHNYFEDPNGENIINHKEDVIIVATGHTIVVDDAIPSTCKELGKTAGSHCSVCGETIVAQSDVMKKSHTEVVDAAVEATCTELGKTAGSHCSVCGETIVAQEVVTKKSHTEVVDVAVEATCETAGKTAGSHCSVCGETIVAQREVTKKSHTEVMDAAVEATCETAGKTAGSHCSVCNQILEPQEVIAALGHKEVIDPAVAPTCGEAGKTEGSHCLVCNRIIKRQRRVQPTGHEIEIDAAVEATCEKEGKTAGSHCAICKEVIAEQVEISATGHTWYDGVITTQATETTSGVMTYTCNVCEATQTVIIPPNNHQHTIKEIAAVEATCEEAGNCKYYECEECHIYFSDSNGEYVIDKESVEILPTGHKEVRDKFVEATCEEAGKTAGTHCSVCDKVLIAQEIIAAKGHMWDEGEITTEATETIPGVMTYKCSVCQKEETYVIPVIGHIHTMKNITKKDATCEADGNDAYYVCESCDNYYEDEQGEKLIRHKEAVIVPATGHTAVFDEEKEATCEKEGKTAGSHCSVCGKILVVPNNILKKPHTEVVDEEEEATCEEAGKTAGSHCSICNKVINVQEVIAAKGHEWDDGVITTEATQTEKGVKTYTCSVCGVTKTEEIPKKEDENLADVKETAVLELEKVQKDMNTWVDGLASVKEKDSLKDYMKEIIQENGEYITSATTQEEVMDAVDVAKRQINEKIQEVVTQMLSDFSEVKYDEEHNALLKDLESIKDMLNEEEKSKLEKAKEQYQVLEQEAIKDSLKDEKVEAEKELLLEQNREIAKVKGFRSITDSKKKEWIQKIEEATNLAKNEIAKAGTQEDVTKVVKEAKDAMQDVVKSVIADMVSKLDGVVLDTESKTLLEDLQSIQNDLDAKQKIMLTKAQNNYNTLEQEEKNKIEKEQTAIEEAKKGTVSYEESDKILQSTNTDKKDPSDSTFAKLQLKGVGKSKSIKLTWKSVTGAEGYIVYGAACGTKLKELKTVTGKSYTVKNLKKGKYYKYIVKAYKTVAGEKRILAVSKSVHVATNGGTYGNPSKVTYGKQKVSVKKGKKFTLKPKMVANKAVKKHIAKIRYESSDSAIATVNKDGKIIGKKKGSCTVYIYTQNGCCKKVKVTVK